MPGVRVIWSWLAWGKHFIEEGATSGRRSVAHWAKREPRESGALHGLFLKLGLGLNGQKKSIEELSHESTIDT
jgi:hypothetical protein